MRAEEYLNDQHAYYEVLKDKGVLRVVHSIMEQYASLKKSEVCRYDLTFGNYFKMGIEVTDNKIKVIGAMNGYGDSIMNELTIENLNAPEPEDER